MSRPATSISYTPKCDDSHVPRPRRGPRCAGKRCGCRSLPGGSHSHPSLAVAQALPSLCWFACSAPVRRGPCCAGKRRGCRSLTGGSHSRLLNHSYFPFGRAHGFAALLRVALAALRPSAHWAHASLRTLSALAVAQTHIPKYRIWKYTRALSWSGLMSASKPITL